MDTFGLLGFPLTHSFSKNYFTKKFEAEKIKAQYVNFELENPGDIINIIKNNPDILGLNVTIPHKQSVLKYLDRLDPAVYEIGAVNVIKINRSELSIDLIGYNTDVYGFEESFRHHLKSYHHGALILGTGGAARAVAWVLKRLNLNYVYVSRNPIVGRFNYTDIDKRMLEDFPVIINTTPIGMYPNIEQAPEIPYELLTDENYLFDLVYNPEDTLFMQKGAERGAIVKNGLEMLHLQAEAAWRIWNSY